MSELGYLFLTMSSLHIITPDLDVRDHMEYRPMNIRGIEPRFYVFLGQECHIHMLLL